MKVRLIFLLKLVVQSCFLRKKKIQISSSFSLIIKPAVLVEMGFIKMLRRNGNSPHGELLPMHGDQLKDFV